MCLLMVEAKKPQRSSQHLSSSFPQSGLILVLGKRRKGDWWEDAASKFCGEVAARQGVD